jgi:hypothetical protein
MPWKEFSVMEERLDALDALAAEVAELRRRAS